MDVDEGNTDGSKNINANFRLLNNSQALQQRDHHSYINVTSKEYDDLVEWLKEDAYHVILAR